MEEFPKNSYKAKTGSENVEPEGKKKIERVTTTDPVRRKPTLSRRFMSTFVKGDAKKAWVFVVTDVLIPAAKDMAADALSQGFERMIYGETRSRSRRPGYGGNYSPSHVSYNRFGSGINKSRIEENRRPPISRSGRSSHNFDEIILATRVEAEEVVGRLFDCVSQYESASVADLYALVGITGEYTDEKWGWTDLRGTDVSRIRDGYLLNLPKPEPLD